MAFNVTLELTDGIAKISLAGELDASVAGQFKDAVEQAAQAQASKLVLLLSELEYMSSAGLRVLIFAKQKMGAGVDIYVVGAQEQVISTLEKTGFHHSVIVQDVFEPIGAS